MKLSAQGQRIAEELAARHGFSAEAVAHMMRAVLDGNGSMAQFNHSDFGGSGQWMRGGMTMISDMFNNHLKGRVDGLCAEIAQLLASQPNLLQTGSFQSQSQNGTSSQDQSYGSGFGSSDLFVSEPGDEFWPASLGSPTARGNQNNVRYAYFAGSRRLAVQAGGEVWIYDTLDHQIGGFSQQQGGGDSITFSSQFGVVPLSSLPVVSRNEQAMQSAQPPASPASLHVREPHLPQVKGSDEILAAIEKLGELKERGILTEQEFSEKKAQLLSRL